MLGGFIPAPPSAPVVPPLAPRGPVGEFATTVTPEAPPEPPPGIGYVMPERTGEDAASVGNRLMETPEPDADAIVRGATDAASQRPPTTGGGPPMRRTPSWWDYVDTALAGMAGGRPMLSTLGFFLPPRSSWTRVGSS